MGHSTLAFEPWARVGHGSCGTRFLVERGYGKAQLLVRRACCSPWVLVRPGPCAPRLVLLVGRGLCWPRALVRSATRLSSCLCFASANVARRPRRSLRGDGLNVVVQHVVDLSSRVDRATLSQLTGNCHQKLLPKGCNVGRRYSRNLCILCEHTLQSDAQTDQLLDRDRSSSPVYRIPLCLGVRDPGIAELRSIRVV